MTNIILSRRQHLISLILISLGMLVAGALAGSALRAQGWSPFGGHQVPVFLAADQRVSGQVSLNAGFSAVAKAVTPAVVTVETLARVRPQPFPSLFFEDPFGDLFRRGLPDQDDRQTPRRRAPQQQAPQGRGRLQPTGLGSGVIVSPDGYILTNNHVLEGAEKVEVTLADRRHFNARVVGTDAPSDVAVLKIEGSVLPTLPLGDSSKVEVGDVVLAVGNPLGIGQTVTMGIISALGRSTGASGGGSYEDFLQTDAAINRGNSGGALVNLRGEMIGIPSQILSQSGGNIGIGFAIPTAMARTVVDQLMHSGRVRRGKLGINVGPLTADLARQFGYRGAQGALVQDVEPGQAADRAGVKPGDIITEYQGQRIEGSAQLRNLVAQTAPGTSVKFKVWRDGSERELQATLNEVSLAKATGGSGGGTSGTPGGALAGVSVETLTSDLAQRLGLSPATRGVVIDDVDEDSNAVAIGLQAGDVVEEVNRQPVTNVNEYNAAVQRAGKKDVLLRVRRAQQGAFYVVVPVRE